VKEHCAKRIAKYDLNPKQFITDVTKYPRLQVIQRIFSRVVSAVTWLHSQKIAHLDISLENIMIAGGTKYDPLIKLIDFGVARDYSELSTRITPQHDRICGKVHYMGPEVQSVGRLNKSFDPFAADIWTLGVCLWLLMYKEYPFYRPGSGDLPLDKERVTDSKYLKEQMFRRNYLPFTSKDAFIVLKKIFKPEKARINAANLSLLGFCQNETSTKTNPTNTETDVKTD